jgi:hypothetical protein
MNCVSCETLFEDLNHVFFECSLAVQVWQRSGLWESINQAQIHTGTASETMFQLLQVLSSADSQRFAATIWSIWKHRNLKLWQDVKETVAHVVERAVRLLEDWNFANNLSPTLSNTRAAAYDSSRTGLHHSSVV